MGAAQQPRSAWTRQLRARHPLQQISSTQQQGRHRRDGAASDTARWPSSQGAELQSSFSAVADIAKPVVAAVTGYALGGGLELALCVRVPGRGTSAQVGPARDSLGIIPGAGGTQRLPRLIGPARAKELIFTGREVPAAKTWRSGWPTRWSRRGVYQAARDMVARFATGPALALRAAKQAVDIGLEVGVVAGLEIERLQFAALFATEDQKTSMRRFVERSEAAFEGR